MGPCCDGSSELNLAPVSVQGMQRALLPYVAGCKKEDSWTPWEGMMRMCCLGGLRRCHLHRLLWLLSSPSLAASCCFFSEVPPAPLVLSQALPMQAVYCQEAKYKTTAAHGEGMRAILCRATPLKRTGHCMLCVHRTESDGCSPLHCRPVKPLLSVQPVQAYAGPPAEQAGVVLSEPRHTHHLAALRAGRSWPAHHLRANGSMPQRNARFVAIVAVVGHKGWCDGWTDARAQLRSLFSHS